MAGLEAVSGQLDEGFRATLAAAAGVIWFPWLIECVERGPQSGDALGVEATIDHEQPAKRLAQVEVATLIVLVGVGERTVWILAVADLAGDVAQELRVEL